MIAHINDDLHSAAEAVLNQEPLATVAGQTVTSLVAVAQNLTRVHELTVEYGVGKPLIVFQTLIETYQVLAEAHATLAHNAQHILTAAERIAGES